ERIFRVEAHHSVPQRVDQGRQRHGRAGMARLRLLDRIDRKRADGVDRQLVELGAVRSLGVVGIAHGQFLTCWFSKDATLLKRRKCRGAWLNAAARKVCTRSQATFGPTVRPPVQMMLRWSSSTACVAEK